MKKNLQTEAGQNKQHNDALIDALNQAFALFKRNYHNQFFKAFPSETDINALKRVWFDALCNYTPQVVMDAAVAIVKTSEFLPTLKKMLDHCDRLAHNTLPVTRVAYAEACNAASPKAEQLWSHPAVYLAGKQVGWHFLQSNSEHLAFPAFKAAFETLAERARAGEALEIEKPIKIDPPTVTPASDATSKKYMNELNSLFNDENS